MTSLFTVFEVAIWVKEYLIPTNNIIVLDSYFNMMNKSNLVGTL